MAQPWILTYLTVFKSRIGTQNLVLQQTGFTHQPAATLQRRVKLAVEQRLQIDLNEGSSEAVLCHLVDKGLISANRRKSGRYQGLTLSKEDGVWLCRNVRGDSIDTLQVYLVDLWMSDPRLRSTVGAPTPDNVDEIIEFSYQLHLISKAKNTWTAGGHLVKALRQYSEELDSTQLDNPFVLGVELPGFLRQIIDSDGLLLRELVRELVDLKSFRRDDLRAIFGVVVTRVAAMARSLRLSLDDLKDIRSLEGAVRKALNSSKPANNGRTGKSTGPGVVEHRLSPRLEWLTDLGYLSKDGLPRNSFEYIVAPDLRHLLDSLDLFYGSNHWGAEVAAREWASNSTWAALRSRYALYGGEDRFLRGYRLLKRSIGPVHIEELLVMAAVLSQEECTYSDLSLDLMSFADRTPGIKLSGGRYQRSPENIFIPDDLLENR